jgi:protein SCO1/2
MRGLTALMVALLVLAAPAGAADFKGGLLSPPRPAADFTLTTQDGKEFRLGRERGKVVALWFGYTFCPDVCPTTLADLVQAQQALGKDVDRFRIVLVTVDPERDTPARLREYVKAFGGSFTAVTGAPERLAEVRKAYGVVAEKRVVPGTSATYLIDHSAFVYVVDPTGQLRLMFPFGMSVPDMVHDIKRLLQ